MFRLSVIAGGALVLSVGAAPMASADTLGGACNDWMKIGTDSSTGEPMFCAASSTSDETKLTWQPWSEGAWGTLPLVGKAGSLCTLPLYTFGRSPEGYVVWCFRGTQALLPGGQTLENPSTPVWSVYSP